MLGISNIKIIEIWESGVLAIIEGRVMLTSILTLLEFGGWWVLSDNS